MGAEKEQTRYWRGSCTDPDITERMGASPILTWRTIGEHKETSADVHEFPFDCPICETKHTALEVSAEEYKILSDLDDELGGTIPDFVVDGIGEWAGPPEELLTVDVMKVTPQDPDDFSTVGSYCSECDKEIALGQEVMLWGEPLGDGKRFVAIKTFDTDECLHAALTAYNEKKGTSAMLIRYRT